MEKASKKVVFQVFLVRDQEKKALDSGISIFRTILLMWRLLNLIQLFMNLLINKVEKTIHHLKLSEANRKNRMRGIHKI